MIKKIKQYFCKHHWQLVHKYNFTADYKCAKCEKCIKETIFFLKP